MRIIDLIKISFKDLLRTKTNYVNIIFISLTTALIVFGLSFSNSLNNYWNESIKKMIDYRTFFVYYDHEQYSEKTAITTLNSFKHVESISPYSSYFISMRTFELVNDNTEIFMLFFGVPPKSVNVTSGEDIGSYDSHDRVMICPETIFYDMRVDNKTQIKTLDLVSYIGEEFYLSFITDDVNYEKFKLIGTYDSSSRQGNDNLCYTNSDVVTELNLNYQPQAFQEEEGIFYPLIVRIDNTDNISKTLVELEEKGFYTNGDAVVKVDTSSGDKILNLITCICLISVIFSFLITMFTFMKNQGTKIRNFALLKTIGYGQRDISRIQHCESCFSAVLTTLLALAMSYTIKVLFSSNFINRNEMFNGLKLEISNEGIILGLIFSFSIYFILTIFSNKRIFKNNVMKELNRE